MLTGNPVRSDIIGCNTKRFQALAHFNLQPNKKTILVIGGSLGARTLNESTAQSLNQLVAEGYQLIWQTGKTYHQTAQEKTAEFAEKGVRVFDFIKTMDLAYAASDLVISRAGALSISELCLVGKPAILVPSPNVAEDHQTKNAMALVQKSAALLVKDSEANSKLYPEAFALLKDEVRLQELSTNVLSLSKPGATAEIVNELIKLL